MAARDIILGHQALLDKHNTPWMAWNDPRLLQNYQTQGQLDPYQAAAVSKYAHDYYDKTKQAIPEDHLDYVLDQARAGFPPEAPSLNGTPSSSQGDHVADTLKHVINLNGGQSLQGGDPRIEAVFRTTGLQPPDLATDASHKWADATNQYSAYMAPGAIDHMLGQQDR